MTIARRYGLGLLLVISMPAAGQEKTEPKPGTQKAQLEEVVVTAQKRTQTLADVPISVSVFSERFIGRSRTATVADLVAFTPGVSGTTVSGTTPRITVRGVSTEDFGVGSDPALGIYIDDVYLGRGVSSITDLFDIKRVEVVRGPQGTLFGRNTTAGAISIVTNKPSVAGYDGNLDVSAGSFGLIAVRGAVNIPLDDRWALRLSGLSRDRDGIVGNTLGGRIGAVDSKAGRATLGYTGNELRATASFEYRRNRSQPGPYINPILVGTDPYGPVSSNLIDNTADAARDDIDSYRGTVRLEADLGEGITLSSITAYNGFNNRYLEDTDASPLTLVHFGTKGAQDSYSQELRLNGRSGRVTWFAGASVARDDIRSDQFGIYSEEDYCQILYSATCTDVVGAPGAARVREQSLASTSNTSYAAYGEARLAITPRLDLTGGLRFSGDIKDFQVRLPLNDNLLGPALILPPDSAQLARYGTLSDNGTLTQHYDTTSWQPRVALDYRLMPGVLAYASAARGYKAGGFNQLSPGPSFRPENIWSYEVGIKGETPDRRLRFDVSAFHFDYDDLQVLVNFGPSVITRNAATATGDGVETAITLLPIAGLTLTGGLSYQDVHYGRFIGGGQDYSGNRLVRAPRLSTFLVADAAIPVSPALELLARGEVSYRSRQFFAASNAPFTSQAGFALVNLSAGVGIRSKYEVRAFVSNLLDRRYLVDASIVSAGLLQYTQRGEPRVIGAQVLARF